MRHPSGLCAAISNSHQKMNQKLYLCCLILVLVAASSSFSPSSSAVRSSQTPSRIRGVSQRTNLIDARDDATNQTFIASEDDDYALMIETVTSSQLPHKRLTTITSNNDEATLVTDLPRHIAFICDGNCRWSKRHSLPKSIGHAAGADRVINIIKALQRYRGKIEYCTLYAFSTENWTRSEKEINTIFKLMERIAIQYRSHDDVRSGKVQIDLLGDLEDKRIPAGAKKELQRLQSESKVACEKQKDRLGDSANVLTICLAINYGARADILQAAQKLAQSIASGELSIDAAIEESEISKRLCTALIPDPDLIIRTSGETRLSNFLLWNAAYAELYFTDLLWPDFDEYALEEALAWYGKRTRRFGGRNE